MEGVVIEYFPNTVDTGSNETISQFRSYISDENEQDACDSHAHTIQLFNIKIIDLGLLVYGISMVWEDTDGCAKE